MKKICTFVFIFVFAVILLAQGNNNKPAALIYESEPNNSASQANAVSYGDSVLANISSDADADYFTFSGTAGDTVAIMANSRNNSNFKLMVKLFNSSGTIINYNYSNTENFDVRIPVILNSTGTYYIRISNSSNGGGFPNKPVITEAVKNPSGTIGDYQFTLKKFAKAAPVIMAVYPKYIFSNGVSFMSYIYTNGILAAGSFEYGTTSAYGNTIGSDSGPINSGLGNQILNSLYVTGLSPNTEYHYRIRVENSEGVSYSPDQTFTTPISIDGWNVVNGNFNNLFTVTVIDQNKIFTGGTSISGIAFYSTNTGSTWNVSSGLNYMINSSCFVNQNLGFLVAQGGRIYKTTDSGVSWNLIYENSAINLFSVFFSDENNGLALDYSNKAYKTTNSGSTWSEVTLYPSLVYPLSVKMVNNFAYISGTYALFLKSTDYGNTWTKIPITDAGNNYLQSLYCIDKDNIFVVGTNGYIAKSTDGGNTWTRITSNVPQALKSITFQDNKNGIIVGDAGVILRTTDGGATWLKQTSGCTIDFTCVSYKNNVAFVSGGFGTLLKNTNYLDITSPAGGENWILGTNQNITWSQSGLTNIKIDYSTNNGTDWGQVVSSTPANNNSFSWLLPNTLTQQAKIKITDLANTANYRISNVFSIIPKPAINETEPNNTASQAMSVAYGDSVIGSITPSGDVDYFRFSAAAGDTIEITSGQRNNSNLYGILKLYDFNNQYLTNNYKYGDNASARIVYVIQSSGQYYIRFSDNLNSGVFPNKPEALTGDYFIRFRKYAPSAPVISVITPRYILYNGASLWSSIYTNGQPVTATYEYGLSTSYGTSVPAIGNPLQPSIYLQDARPNIITGLTPNTTYHYRIKLESAAGITYSDDQNFTTVTSTDGWQNLTFLDVGLTTVQVINKNNIFVSGSTTRRTTNGGANWLTVSGIQQQVNQTSFINSNIAFSVGTNGSITKSTDAGATWTNLTSGITTNLKSVSFSDVNNGIVAVESGIILKTTNGGSSWSQITIPVSGGFNKIKMVNNLIGYAIKSTVYKTTDGGNNWAALTIPQFAGTLNSLVCLDENTVFAVSDNSKIIRTLNGGLNWDDTAVPNSSSTLYDIAFMDRNNGIAAGRDGLIVKTINGGNTWYRPTSGVNGILFAVGYSDNTAYVSGVYGLMLKNTNYLILTSFIGGESVTSGTATSIAWAQSGLDYIKIEYTTNNGTNWITIITSTPAATGSFTWNIPSMAGSASCKIRISDVSNSNLYAISGGVFTIFNLPEKPVLVTPANNSTNQPVTCLFTWRSMQYTEKYKFELSTDSLFNNVVLRDTLLTDTLKNVTLANNTSYYWRVMGKNSFGYSSWSDVWRLKTIAILKNISGAVTYYNTQNTPLKNVTIMLNELSTGNLNIAATDTSGRYSFGNMPPGKYLISASKTGNSGGLTAADALIVARYFTYGDPLDLLQMCAADMNNSGSLNSADALLVLQKYIGLISVLPQNKPEWVFKTSTMAVQRNLSLTTALEGPDTIEVQNADLTVNIFGLCTGDVNKSFVPTGLSKIRELLVKKETAVFSSIIEGIEIPVKTGVISSLGSVSMKIKYPSELAVFSGVKFDNRLSSALVNEKNGIISISWAANNLYKNTGFGDNETLFTIKLKIPKNLNLCDKIWINIDPESELTDIKGESVYPDLRITDISIAAPESFSLSQNYPNPFNPVTNIGYSIPERSIIKIIVFNTLGQKVCELVNGIKEAGTYEAFFDAAALTSGIYYYTLEAKGIISGKEFRNSKKMALIK